MVLKAVTLGILYLTVYYLLGFAVVRLAGGNERRNSTFLFGFFIYSVSFWMIGFPMKLFKVTVTKIGIVWIFLLVMSLSIIIWRLHDALKDDWKHRINRVWQHKWVSLGIVVVVLVELIYIEVQSVPGSPLDASYYIGEVSSAVFHNMAGVADPHSGAELSKFHMAYVIETYQLHSSVMCRLFNIPPLVEVRTVMAGIAVILYNIVLFQIGKCLFGRCYWKIFLLLAGVGIICFFSSSTFVPGAFLMARAFEGKNFLANIFIPAVFLFFLQLVDGERQCQCVWIGMFLAISASYTYSMSALFLMPVLLCGVFPPLIFHKRSRETVMNAFICMIPCILMVIFYIGVLKGYIQFMV